MIFGKRPPRAVRRHLETEIAADISSSAETSRPDDGSTDPQIIRTPRMKPFARIETPESPRSVTPRPAFQGPKPTTESKLAPAPRAAAALIPPKTPPRLAKTVAQPNPRGSRPEPQKIPGHTLVVGREIRLTGEISACHRLVVEGSVEADLTDTHTLEIADTGHFRGSAVVGNCVISGSFDGDLTVSGLLAVRAGGRVGGAIRYAEIEIERGGRISGRTDVRTADAQGPQEVSDAPRPANPPRTASRSGLRPA